MKNRSIGSKKVLGIGYISHRNDGMTELRINGHRQVMQILERLMPFLKFKKKQAKAIINSAKLLLEVGPNKVSMKEEISGQYSYCPISKLCNKT